MDDATVAASPDAGFDTADLTTFCRLEAAWVGDRVERFHQDREYLSDVDAARMLVAIGETTIRDAAVSSMNRSTAPVASELWLDFVRRSPASVRDTPVTLLAFSSFLEGRGAQAWVALDELSQSNRLTDLIAAALTHAVEAREWDKALPAARTPMQHAALLQAALGEAPAPGSDPAGLNEVWSKSVGQDRDPVRYSGPE